MSLALVGDNSLTKPLRILTSLELFLHANFYSKHPVFLSTFSKRKDDIYKCFNNLLLMCVPFHVVNSGLQGDDLIIIEAISNSQDKHWSGFLCILALSSVISRNIIYFYPSFGETRYKTLFNQKIEPRIPLKAIPSVDDVYLLFCFNGLIKGNFEPNHFVPLIRTGKRNISNKRSISQPAPQILPKRQMTSTSYTQDPNEKIQSKLYFYMHKSSKPEMSDINTSHSELNLSNTSVTSNSLDIPDTLASSIPDTTDSAVKNIFSSSSSQLQEPSSSSSIPTQECVDTESISHENI